MIRGGIRRAFRLALRRRDRWEREVEEEIKLHLELRAEQLMAHGRSIDDAYAEAVRRFGPLHESTARLVEAARHREQRMQRVEYLSDLRQDVAFALRTLSRRKAWTAVTILTLALGVGATTAVFGVVSTLLLHPLEYPHGDRVVLVDLQPTQGNNTGISVSILPSPPIVRVWQRYAHGIDAMVAAQLSRRPLKTVSGEPSEAFVAAALPGFFDFAGVRPELGRVFTQHDVVAGGAVAVLNVSFWRNRLGGDPGVIGRTITLRDSSYMIVGVVPQTHFGHVSSRAPDIWIPADIRGDNLGLSVMARLHPGVSNERAARELDAIAARTDDMRLTPFRTIVSAPAESVRFSDSLIMLTAAVAVVLLVACANVAHLLLARSTARARELAVRAALGAGRGRLMRQLLTEALLLTLSGTGIGVFAGWLGLTGLVALRPPSLDELRIARLDPTTLVVAVAVAIFSGIAFAVIGGMHARRSATPDTLRTAGPIDSARGRRSGRVRGALIVSEMAMSATLLVGATLLVRSMQRLQAADLGFDPRGLYAIELPLNTPAFDAEAARRAAQRELMARVARMRQIRAATLTPVAPGSRWFSIGRLEIEGERVADRGTTSFIDINSVQPNYFQTMRIALPFGTTFTDTSAAAHQVIVNASFAHKHWPQGAALGHRIRVAQSDTTPWMSIVGIAADVRSGGPMGESTAPVFYTAYTGNSARPTLLIRTEADASTLAPIVDIARQLGAKGTPPPQPVTRTIDHSISGPRFIMTILTIFTALALLLAAIGLYGVMSYTVAQETREIGIRVALGASERRIARAVLGRGAALAAVGAVAGLAAATWGTRLIAGQLYGVERLDPVSYVVGGVALIGTALLACVVPTRRALGVDPMTAIRAE